MSSSTNRGQQSKTATTSARSPARIITYTIALRRAYNAQTSQPPLHARNFDTDPNTIAMGHCISTTSSTSRSSGSSLAGTATTITDLTDAEGQHTRATSRIDAPANTPSNSENHPNPPKWKRSVASETAVPDPSPVGGLRGSARRRKTAGLFFFKEPANLQRHGNNHNTSAQQQPTAGFDHFASKALPPTPPPSTPTSHKSSSTAATTSNHAAVAAAAAVGVRKAEPTPKPSLTITVPPTPLSPLSSTTITTTTSTPPSPIYTFTPLPDRLDPQGTHAHSIRSLRKTFKRHSLSTRALRRAYLYSLPHAKWADAARWLHDNRRDLWEDAEEEAVGYTWLEADGYADIMRARLGKAKFCWEWVAMYGEKGGTRVEVGEAQERLFGEEWAFKKGVWGERTGPSEVEEGPRGERVENL